MERPSAVFNLPHGERFLKEWFGSVYFHWERYGDTTLAPYLAAQFNANFGLPAGSTYRMTFAYDRVLLEASDFRIDYTPHPELSRRRVVVTPIERKT